MTNLSVMRGASLKLLGIAAVALLPIAARGAKVDDTPEREVAEWVLRQGGEVILHGENRRIRDLRALPVEPFRIHTINFVDIHTATGDLQRFGELADLRRLYVSSRIQTRGPRPGSVWQFLKTLKHLETFVNSEPVSSAPISPDDEALKLFGAPENLRELRVTRSAVKGTTLGRFPNLRHLDLSYSELNDEGMGQLAGMQNLAKLSLRDTGITDASLVSLRGLSQLQELDLQGTRVSDTGLENLAGLGELRKLNLLGTRTSDRSVAILAKLSKLEEINLYRTNVSNLSMESLKAVAGLRSLDLRYSQVTHAGVEALEKSLPQCKILFQDSVVATAANTRAPVATQREALKWIREIGGKVVAVKGQVRELSLAATSTSDPDLKMLRLFTRLEKLDLSGTQISDLGTAPLAGLMFLTEVKLNDTAVTDETLKFIGQLKNLQRLSLVNTRVRGLANLTGLPFLKHLDLSGSNLTDEGLARVGALKQLTVLSVNYTGVSDQGMESLKPLSALERLELTGVDLTDKGLAPLPSLTNLRVLWLRHVRLTDAGLETVSGLSQLTELDLGSSSQYSLIRTPGMQKLASLSNLRKLNLDYNPVTDSVLEAFSSLKDLEELRLNGSDITDAAAPHLKKLSKLRLLDLYHTLVTKPVFDDLKVALPACRFIWELDSSFEDRRKS